MTEFSDEPWPKAIWRITSKRGSVACALSNTEIFLSVDNPGIIVLVGMGIIEALNTCHDNNWVPTLVGEECCVSSMK